MVESSRDELLERIALTLEPIPERFEKFHGRVHGMRARMSGQPSVAARTLGGTRAATAGAREAAPGLVTGVANVVAQNPLMDIAVERGEARRTIEEVQKVFMEGLAELARERPERVALLFSDLHLRPDEPNVRWLRRWLFPKLARMRVLLVLSAETEHKLADVAAMFSDRHLVRLDRLSDDEAMEFVVRAVGLAQDTPLARALVRDSDRFPSGWPDSRTGSATTPTPSATTRSRPARRSGPWAARPRSCSAALTARSCATWCSARPRCVGSTRSC